MFNSKGPETLSGTSLSNKIETYYFRGGSFKGEVQIRLLVSFFSIIDRNRPNALLFYYALICSTILTHQFTLRSRPCHSFSLNLYFCILPVAVFGNSPNSTAFGALNLARLALQKSMID